MSRISELFDLCRDTLNDPNKQRWSDDTLLRNLKLGIKDVAKQSELFKNIITIPLIPGTAVYQMPDGILTLSHATHNKLPLPLRTHEWMNKNTHTFWRTDTVEYPDNQIEMLVFDEVKRKQVRAYPIPVGDLSEVYISVPNEYGLVGGIDTYDQPEQYGLLADLVDTDLAPPIQDSPYGVATLIGENQGITIYYTRTPPLPDDIEDDYELDEMFDMALKFYICGTCLRNDLDIENRNIASEEFKLYQREMDAIIDLAHSDSVSAEWFESHYNPMG